MKLGSLFDGSGTCPLAAEMCGITPVWASEIEPYPIKVTKARFPAMKHLGDITKLNGGDRACGHHHLRQPVPGSVCRGQSSRTERGHTEQPLLRGNPHHRGNEGSHKWSIPKNRCLGKRSRSLQQQRRKGLPDRPPGVLRLRKRRARRCS